MNSTIKITRRTIVLRIQIEISKISTLTISKVYWILQFHIAHLAHLAHQIHQVHRVILVNKNKQEG